MANGLLRLFVYAMGITAFAAGLYGNAMLLFTGLLVLLGVGAAYVWNHYAFSKLTIRRQIQPSRVEYRSPATYRLEAVNKKILPMFWLKVEDPVSEGISFAGNKFLHKASAGNQRFFQDLLSLLWYQKVARSYEVTPQRRGLFRFGKGRLSYSDPFGLFRREDEDCLDTADLIVYPRILPLGMLGIKETRIFGSRMKDGWLFTDPLNRVGTRPYRSTDSLRQINWKVSARHLHLQTDLIKPSFDNEGHIFLDHTSNLVWWGAESMEKLEFAIVVAASLMEKLCKERYTIGFYSNVVRHHHRRGSYTKAKPNYGQNQRRQLLTTLALLKQYSYGSMARIIETERAAIRPGATVFFITTAGDLSGPVRNSLQRLRTLGHLTILRVGEKRPPDSKDPRSHHIHEGSTWDEVKGSQTSH